MDICPGARVPNDVMSSGLCVCVCVCVSAEFRRFSAVLTMSIALAANIGGTATLIGSGPNVVLAGITERSHPTSVLLTPCSGSNARISNF